MLEVGQVYYLISHAYYHWVGEIAEVYGPQRVKLGRTVRVHSCARDFTAFFRDGWGNDTTFTEWPSGSVTTFFHATPWVHGFPDAAPTRRTR